jgi:ABC-type transport system involved in cytochrome bd biosynthesis fused ATPase/permease subunit
LAAVELDERIAAAGGLDAWITQDMLSLGEARRLSLARAWLSDAPVILLDEPTEHIGREQGHRIMARLRRHFHDRIVICTAHDRSILPDAAEVRLE